MSGSAEVRKNTPHNFHETILIVDDQPENLAVLSGILDSHYRVRAVRSGEQALRTAATEPIPDLILLDVTMPEMDGYTVMERLHDHPATRDIPVIFVTARDAPEDEQYGLEKGAVDYIAKPVQPAIVLARVKAHLEVKQARDRLRTQNEWLEAEVERRVQENLRIVQEKEKIEQQLFHAQKLEAIGTLAGGIAHDFNNILAPVIGYTEMAIDEIPAESSAHECLGHVLAAAHRAKELVGQILSFSRMGKEQTMGPFDLRMIVQEALKLLRASLPSSIEIRQKIEKGMVLADATQIHQVVVNLCTNAVQAMGEKGILSVSLVREELGSHESARLPLDGLEPGPYLKLSVADTGSGMDEQTMQRIFDPYFTTKEAGKGTGLGLAVVHGIVGRHGGKIVVRSEVGKGSVFEVLLPMMTTESLTMEVQPEKPRGGTERVLLVDDESVIVELGARILGQLGYRVIAKTHPLEAWEFFRANPQAVDLVVTDYTMPDMSGIELAREVLLVRPDMPVILCTGFSERLTVEKVKTMGIAGLVMKPITKRDLGMIVREVLDGKKP